jgi:phage tail-like protein
MIFPGLSPSNPLPGFNFAVAFAESLEVAGAIAQGGVERVAAGFQEVTGLESSIEIHDYKEGGRNDFRHKFATNANFGNITFKRGVALTPDLWTWYDRVRRGSFGARRSIMIAQLDYERNAALVWYVSRALPAKYTGPGWNASQNSVAIESLEVAHEGLELVPGGDFALGQAASGAL